MDPMKEVLLTLPELARRTGISLPTLRLYSDSGLVPCQYDTRGNRLFVEAAVEKARQVRASRTRRLGAPAIAQAGNGG